MNPVEGFGREPGLIDPHRLPHWILHEDENLLVINKPGWVVCHPSKNGPWSSLVGACKEYLGLSKLHLVARLDRETSGVVLFAKNPRTARQFQMALERRRVRKEYIALLQGNLHEDSVRVEESLIRDTESPVHIKQKVGRGRHSQPSVTYFHSLEKVEDCTLAWVYPETGRKHQIRAHAQWLECPVVGDKVYGPDASDYLEFIQTGWTPDLAKKLGLFRQALHALRMVFFFGAETWVFSAPLPDELTEYFSQRMGLPRRYWNEHALLQKTGHLRLKHYG